MQNKKTYLLLAIVVMVVAAAAFVGGRLLNGQAGALGFLPFGNGAVSTFAIDMKPAPELPTTQPEAAGSLVERKDNTLTIQVFSMEAGGGGIVVSSVSVSGESSTVTSEGNDGPKVEVVVTRETKIYKDVTPFDLSAAPSGETQTLQQVVEPGSLDDLGKQATVSAWGRKNGDRIIADVVLYTAPIMIQP